jgi:hypothetical protein
LFSLNLSAQFQIKKVGATKIKNKTIVVDGKLDEPLWQKSAVATDFIQFEPHKGRPASFKTEARILFDDRFIFIGVSCYDPEPEKIVSRITKREGVIDSDDSISIGLDTFADKRTAYAFFTNILGTQLDGRLSDNGRTWDTTWDAEWKSKGSRTEYGWCVEVAIPFASLKFNPGKNKTWGFGLGRIIPRKLERSTWTGPVEDFDRVSQFGVLTGLDLKKTRKKYQIIPHVITKVEQDEKTEFEAGIDIRYAFSQAVSANLTVNPDFAIIEADEEVVNLTRFETFLPEKRNFFLEGSEIYQQRIKLFYSRRIEDIYGGLKLYGKLGKYEFSTLVVQSKPGDDPEDLSANYTVFRLRRDFSKSSNIGFLMANKLTDGRLSGSAGIDIVHFFSEKVNFTGQFCLSYGEHNTRNLAFFLRPSYDSSTFHIHLRYTRLGEHFADNANEVGFHRDDDRHELDSNITKTWWIKKHGIDRLEYSSNYNIYWSIKGTLRSWDIFQQVEVDFSNKLSLEIEYNNEFKLYEKKFYNHSTQFELGYNTREWQYAVARYEFGRNFDSDYYLFGGGVNLKLLKSLSLEYRLNRLYLDPDPDDENKWIHILRLTNYFTKDLYLKFFYQTNTAISKQNIQLVFVYRFQPPFGTIQLAYQKGTSRIGEESEQGHTLFLKFSYVF